MNIPIRLASLFVTFFTPALASAALYIGNDSRDISWVAGKVIYIVNSVLVPTIFALAFIVFLYGVAKTYIFSSGDQGGVETGHKLILWGIIGFVVMISLWGLVNIVSNTFGLDGAFAPMPPQSTNAY